MDGLMNETLDSYLSAYEEIKRKVNGDERAATALLQELAKDRRVQQMRAERQQENGDAKATEKQIAFLERLNVAIPEGLTKKQASALIDDALEKQNEVY